MVSISCGPNPLLNEYQIVNYIPMPDAGAAKLIVDGRELYCLFVTESNGTRDSLYVFDIADPAHPVRRRSESLSVAMDLWDMYYSAPYAINYNDFTGRLRALDLVSLAHSEVYIRQGLTGLAFKPGLLFCVADSGLMIWDISDIRNPVRIFSAAESATSWRKMIAVYDTLGFETVETGGTHYRLWNIANPRAASVIGEGDLGLASVAKTLIDDYAVFVQRGGIARHEYTESGSLRRVEWTYNAPMFLVHDREIIYQWLDKLNIGDAFDFSKEATEVPLVDYTWIVAPAADAIFTFAPKRGIYVYRSKGD